MRNDGCIKCVTTINHLLYFYLQPGRHRSLNSIFIALELIWLISIWSVSLHVQSGQKPPLIAGGNLFSEGFQGTLHPSMKCIFTSKIAQPIRD